MRATRNWHNFRSWARNQNSRCFVSPSACDVTFGWTTSSFLLPLSQSLSLSLSFWASFRAKSSCEALKNQQASISCLPFANEAKWKWNENTFQWLIYHSPPPLKHTNTHRGTERIPTDLGHRVNPCFFSYKHSWDTFQSAARERSEEKERNWVNLKISTEFDYKICCEGINWEFKRI